MFVGGTERREDQAAGSSSKALMVRKRDSSRQIVIFNSWISLPQSPTWTTQNLEAVSKISKWSLLYLFLAMRKNQKPPIRSGIEIFSLLLTFLAFERSITCAIKAMVDARG